MADTPSRVMGQTIVKAIIYGSIAKDIRYQKREDGHTHKWRVYVRPYLDEDMGKWVKKISFKLHDSYVIPNRTVNKPPFEIAETGWGEFEFTIKIFFADPNERTVILHHHLKLYKDGPGTEPGENQIVSKPVVSDLVVSEPVISESYEEIIFQEPTEYMSYILQDSMSTDHPIAEQHLHYEDIKKNTLANIMKARKKVQDHIARHKEHLIKIRECINKYNDEIRASESQCCSSSLKK